MPDKRNYSHTELRRNQKTLKVMFLNQILNPKPSAYSAAIANATGAHRMQVPIIERIMRESVFHSTLDWQTQEQFDAGALEALKEYQDLKEFYDAENKCIIYHFHLAKTEDKLEKMFVKLNRATAKNLPELIAKCEAEVLKLQKKRDQIAEQWELHERIKTRFLQILT